jgi:hypothetical protein
MTFSISRATVPAYVRGLHVLSRYLDKAIAHAQAAGTDPQALFDARLAPDMLPLSAQIQRSSDTAKSAIARLLGVDPPKFEDNETTLDELKARIAKTIAYLEAADTTALDAGATREISLSFGQLKKTFAGDDYVLAFALPNFYFHVAIAHAILRNQGVAVGKLDYLGAAN